MKNHSLALGALLAAIAVMSAGCNKESGQANTDKAMESTSMPQSAPQAEQAAGEMAKPAEQAPQSGMPQSEMPQSGMPQSETPK